MGSPKQQKTKHRIILIMFQATIDPRSPFQTQNYIVTGHGHTLVGHPNKYVIMADGFFPSSQRPAHFYGQEARRIAEALNDYEGLSFQNVTHIVRLCKSSCELFR